MNYLMKMSTHLPQEVLKDEEYTVHTYSKNSAIYFFLNLNLLVYFLTNYSNNS